MNTSRKHAFEWLLRMAVCLAVLALTHGHLSRAARASAPTKEGCRWAILIGVERYHLASNLRFTINDVKQLHKTLCQHGGYSEECILEMVDTGPNESFQPLRKSILAELPRWLAKPGPDDMVLVYFTGHGFRDPKDGKLYLAPLDCDPKNPAETGVAVQWLREQLSGCKAKVKLLILDACHAGNEKGDDGSSGVSAKDLGAPFEDLLNVVTLASSTSAEKSLIWGEMRQSLFSFWLNQGLKGHADRDGDSTVTIDEIHKFVYHNVLETSENVFKQSQHPVRIVRSETLGVPVVVRLEPYTFKGTLENMAEQLAAVMRTKGLARVGVAQFTASTTDPKVVPLLRNGPGLLGRKCAEDLEERLRRKMADKFEVAGHDALHKSLCEEHFSVPDLKTTAIKGLTVEGKELPVIAVGMFSARTGRIVSLQCQLIGTEDQEVHGTAGGTALLSPSEWGMLGRSAVMGPDEWPAPRPGRPSAYAAMINELDRRSQGAHPLLGRDFPYRAKIMVEARRNGRSTWKERKPTFHGNDMFVPLSLGEVFQVWVENHADQQVFVKVLVDGLNTLPEKSHAKGIAVEAADGKKPEYLPAQRVNLTEARAWLVEPAHYKNGKRVPEVNGIYGFFTKIGGDGEKSKVKEFKVVDAPTSVAAQYGFTEQIGLITVAFYRTMPKRGRKGARGPGAGYGKEYDVQVDTYSGDKMPGRELAILNIRYVYPEELARLEREWKQPISPRSTE